MKQLRVQPHSSKPYGDVFARGSQRGRRANKPSLPRLSLPPHVDDEAPVLPAPPTAPEPGADQ
jgi:hypothetical protein